MAEAATILVPALVTVSVGLSAVARTLDLVSLAHDDVAPFSPTGGTFPVLHNRGRELLQNVETLKDATIWYSQFVLRNVPVITLLLLLNLYYLQMLKAELERISVAS